MQAQSKVEQGSVFGAILLVAGCCIGAGMLGLPILSATAGFQPSLFMFLISWLFMTVTGLLLLEVSLHFPGEANIVSMAEKTLGFFGKAIAWGGFLFLFYCLMVAYISGSGDLIGDMLYAATGHTLPIWVGALICSAILSIILYMGTQTADYVNRLFMVGLVISYFLLVFLAAPKVDLNFLSHQDWSMATAVLPIMIISFGYHNLVPSLKTYLGGDVRKLRATFIIGGAIPLAIYLLWEYLILGLVPVHGEGGFIEALDEGYMISQILRGKIDSPWLVNALHYFAFFALITSFIGVGLSFLDFLSDGLKIKKTPRGKIALSALVILPPLICALIYPHIFLTALGYAGGIGAVLLFGVLPALMAWSGRYPKKLWNDHLFPGGKALLIVILLFSIGVMVLQLRQVF